MTSVSAGSSGGGGCKTCESREGQAVVRRNILLPWPEKSRWRSHALLQVQRQGFLGVLISSNSSALV
jgi:hypothetical protein